MPGRKAWVGKALKLEVHASIGEKGGFKEAVKYLNAEWMPSGDFRFISLNVKSIFIFAQNN